MGHFLFIILHLLAILFGFVFLFLTIPSHIIYCAIGAARLSKAKERKPAEPLELRNTKLRSDVDQIDYATKQARRKAAELL